MKLYELPAHFAALEATLADGELDEAALAKLAKLEGTLAEKVQACLCVARNFAASRDARRAEAQRLEALAAIDQQNETRLKAYVQKTLEQCGVEKIECTLFKVRLQSNPPSCEVENVEALPPEFVKTKIEPDKKALIAAWEEDAQKVPAGVKITQTRSLRIQ